MKIVLDRKIDYEKLVTEFKGISISYKTYDIECFIEIPDEYEQQVTEWIANQPFEYLNKVAELEDRLKKAEEDITKLKELEEKINRVIEL